ncbi:MAG: cytochrome c3 family protein [Acidobacteriota bacterium]
MTIEEEGRRAVHRRAAATLAAIACSLLIVIIVEAPPDGGEGIRAAEAPGGTPHPDLEGVEDATCADCHEDRVEGAVVHPPAAAGECESCHEFAGAGEETTVSLMLPEEELCVTCHENPAAARGAVARHPPAEEGACTLCHDPHASGLPFLFRDPGSDICLECHGDVAEELERPQVHGAVRSLGCPACHDPHASPVRRLLRRAGNELCLECHLGTSGSHPLSDAGEVLLFERWPADARLFDGIPKIGLRAGGTGHPVARHPVRAERNPLRAEEPFWCGSCHPPHGSLRRPLLVGDSGGSFCLQCHKK